MATLTTLTRELDDTFMNTFYEIRSDSIDNILEATVFTLALKEYGCLKSYMGGTYGWTSRARYGTKSTQRFQEGSTVTQEPKKLVTFPHLDWRYWCVDINRSLIDDAKNTGPYQIKSYIAERMEAARDALVQDLETYLFQWGDYYAAPKQINGIYDIVAPYVDNSTGLTTGGDGGGSDEQLYGTSNGNLDRTNTWWRNWISYSGCAETPASRLAGPTNAPYALNLVADMEHFYNSIAANMEPPNFIITDQAVYEAYKEEARDKMQIVRTAFNKKAADLGFETATFNGATFTYSAKLAGDKYIFMLNMNHIEFNYHPNVWYEMTPWKDQANQFDRVAYIVCMSPGLATSQPRRHGIMQYAS